MSDNLIIPIVSRDISFGIDAGGICRDRPGNRYRGVLAGVQNKTDVLAYILIVVVAHDYAHVIDTCGVGPIRAGHIQLRVTLISG